VREVTFGPSKSPLAFASDSYATEHAEETTEISPGVRRASLPPVWATGESR
jgi:hypothetical protein